VLFEGSPLPPSSFLTVASQESFFEDCQQHLEVSGIFKTVLEASDNLKQVWEGIGHL